MSSGGTGGGGGIILPRAIPAPIDPAQDALLGLLRHGLTILGSLLAAHGLIGPNNAVTPGNWEFIVGLIVTLAPIAWSWWQKFAAAKTAKDRETVAVNATLNLVQSGFALTSDGSRVPAPAAPLKVASPASAQAIIANFAPAKTAA